jgi:hypothetical protein
VANGVDFGSASRLSLPKLTLAEEYLISRSVLFVSLIKLNTSATGSPQTAKRGHVITFPHRGPSDLADHVSPQLADVLPNVAAVYSNITVCFVGARQQNEALVPDRNNRVCELVIRKPVVFRWLTVLKCINHLYADITIDDSPEMLRRLDAIEENLYRAAHIIADERELNIEKIIEQERLSHQPLGLDDTGGDSAGLQGDCAGLPGDCAMPPLPALLVTKLPHVNPSTVPPVTSICAAVQSALETAKQSANAATGQSPRNDTNLDDGNGQTATRPLSPDPPTEEWGTPMPTEPLLPLLVGRSAEPLNEFTENDRLFYTAFPFVFPLGRGLQQPGSIPEAATRHLLNQHDNAAASCVRLLHLLCDQIQRHAVAVQTSIYVKNNPKAFEEWSKWQADPKFLAQLKEAAQHPDRPASRKLAKRILNVVAVVAPKIPFTTSARKTAMPKLLALNYYVCLPSVFLTFAPDDVHGVLNLRLSLPVTSNAQFPAIDDGFLDDLQQRRSISHGVPVSERALKDLLAAGSVAAAETFRILVELIFDHVLGLSSAVSTRRTTLIDQRPPGLLGTPLAAFGCVEEQARGSPHMHIVYWGGLPPALLQSVAENPLFVQLVAATLDNVFRGTATPTAHLSALLRRRRGAEFERPALYPPRHPLHQPELFQQDVDRSAASVQVHKHDRTCHKSNAGKTLCRLSRPQPLLEATRVVQIKPATTPDGRNTYKEMATIEPAPSPSPDSTLDFLRPDSRLIIYEQKRPRLQLRSSATDNDQNGHWVIVCGDDTHAVSADCQKILDGLTAEELTRLQAELASRNGLVVEYNALLTALLGCNTNVSLLGSAAQAKAILCYLLLYVTKTTNEITETLSLLHNARRETEIYGSVADDRGTAHRGALLFIQKSLNDFSGAVEVSTTMAALCALGGEAEVFTHKFFCVFVHAAIQYATQHPSVTAMATDPATGLQPPPEADSHQEGLHHDREQHPSVTTKPTGRATGKKTSPEADADLEWLHDDLELADNYDFNVPLQTPITIPNVPPPKISDTSAPVYRAGSKRIPVPQHDNYAMRGQELACMSLYEYAALINVVPMSQAVKDAFRDQASSTHPGTLPAPSASGRKPNGLFRFHPAHKLYATHVQQLRSRHLVPVPVPRPPVPPASSAAEASKAWQRQAAKCAEYFLVLLKPWSALEGRHPGSLTWETFVDFVDQLRNGIDGSGPSFHDRVQLHWLKNMAAGLRIPNIDRTTVQQFRSRDATRWASQTPDPHLDPPPTQRPDLRPGMDDASAQEAIDFMRNLTHVDDQGTRATRQENLYTETTLAHLQNVADAILPSSDTAQPPTLYSSRFLHLTPEHGTQVWNVITAPYPQNATDDQSSSDSSDGDGQPPERPAGSPSTDTSSGLNAEQQLVLDDCAAYFAAHKRAVQQNHPTPPPFRLLLHGGPGTGKTYLCQAIVQAAQNAGYASSCIAPTGIAAAGLPAGRTVHNFLGIGILKKDQRQAYLPSPTAEKIALFREEHQAGRLRLLVIDEISNLDPAFFGQLDIYLQSMIPNGEKQPFGGLAVLLMGDFLQLPPVGASQRLYEPWDSYPADEIAGRHGAHLFSTFRVVELRQQMRAANDSAHTAMLDRLRWPPADQDRVDIDYINRLKVLSVDDVRSDPSWATTPVIVNTNLLRHAINATVSANFARLVGQSRIIWRTPVIGKYASHLTDSNLVYLYERYPGLSGLFVAGAPAMLTTNINPTLGLANGTAVMMHSLCLHPEDRRRVRRLLNSGGVAEIYLDHPPLFIAVQVLQPNAALSRLPNNSLFPEDGIVIPVYPGSSRNADKHRIRLGSGRFQLETLPNGVELAFSLTVHKIQGQTCDKLIIDLNKTPVKPYLNFQGLLVLLSRVRASADLRILPHHSSNFTYNHLRPLKPPPTLLTWLQSRPSPSQSLRHAPHAPAPQSASVASQSQPQAGKSGHSSYQLCPSSLSSILRV